MRLTNKNSTKKLFIENPSRRFWKRKRVNRHMITNHSFGAFLFDLVPFRTQIVGQTVWTKVTAISFFGRAEAVVANEFWYWWYYICRKNLTQICSTKRPNGRGQPIRMTQLSDTASSSWFGNSESCTGNLQDFNNVMTAETMEDGWQETLENLNQVQTAKNNRRMRKTKKNPRWTIRRAKSE